jgi:hypothetical protein
MIGTNKTTTVPVVKRSPQSRISKAKLAVAALLHVPARRSKVGLALGSLASRRGDADHDAYASVSPPSHPIHRTASGDDDSAR